MSLPTPATKVRGPGSAIRLRGWRRSVRNLFVRDHPDSGAAVELKARSLAEMRRWGEASRLFERVGALTPSGDRAWSLAPLHQERWSDALPRDRQFVVSMSPAPAEFRRTEFDQRFGLGKPRPCHTQRGNTSQASSATGRLPTRWHSFLVTDAASPCLSRPPSRPATWCPHDARPTA